MTPVRVAVHLTLLAPVVAVPSIVPSLVPPDTELMEWICAPSEAVVYRSVVEAQNTQKK